MSGRGGIGGIGVLRLRAARFAQDDTIFCAIRLGGFFGECGEDGTEGEDEDLEGDGLVAGEAEAAFVIADGDEEAAEAGANGADPSEGPMA